MTAPAFPRALVALNLALLVLFPLAWSAPLLRAGLLPLFGLEEVSILSGLARLWTSGERGLAAVVALFALILPIAKTLLLALCHAGRLPARLLPALEIAGRLAMADVFLIALYVTVAKGFAVGRVETAWGLWLFTACVLASLAVSLRTAHLAKVAT